MIEIGGKMVPLTDAGNAELFAHEHGDYLRWVPAWGTWLRFDGQRWARTPVESMIPLAIKTARACYRRAADEPDDKRRQMLVMHARAMESAGKLRAMIDLARGLLVAQADAFDPDPLLLNVSNGTIDMRNGGVFREHRREDLLTKIAPVAFDEAAQCPQWTAFLERVLPDPALREWVQRFIGYSLTGDVGEQVLAFFHGRGANGKSTLLETMLHVLGDYGKPGAPDLLLAKHGESHPTELADLQGARLVVCQETEAGRAWAESLIKRLTGGDKIKARLMRCDFFEFPPTHKLIVSANHRPKVRGQDEGIWRRIKMVPFNVTIPPDERDPYLPEKLRAEAPGILLWAVHGCLLWQESGLGKPAAITAATAEYQVDQDVLAHFVEDHCELAPDDPKAFASHSALYERYVSWCTASGERPWAAAQFREGLRERYRELQAGKELQPGKGAKGVRGFRGLRLSPRSSAFV